MTPARPERHDGQAPTTEKLDLVLRLLAGEHVEDLAREAGRPPKQLTAWCRRFVEGGEAYLEGRRKDHELAALPDARAQLTAKVAELEARNRALSRRVAALDGSASGEHPYCTELYARPFEEQGVRALHVPEWRTRVLVRDARAGMAQATGIRPLAPLDPGADLPAGLVSLREAGVNSISLITDPMWSPELPALEAAFEACRPFKEYYFIDREVSEAHFRKRHRNRVNQARSAGEVCEVDLSEQLDRWLVLYRQNATEREDPQPYPAAYFEQLAQLDGLRAVAVRLDGQIVTLTLWVRHGDILYFNNGASSAQGFAISASYAAFAHVVEHALECRYVFLGGASDFRGAHGDGLAVFKRGFSNASAFSYVCSAVLDRA